MMLRLRATPATLALIATLSACTGPRLETSRPLAATLAADLPDPNPCGRRAEGPAVTPIAGQGTSGVVALARAERDRTLAYIADADARAVRIVDVDRGAELASYDPHGTPSSVLVLDDGRVLVTVADEARVDVIEPRRAPEDGFERRCSVDVPDEPVAIATSPDGARAVVVSRWAHAATELLTAGMFEARRIELARDPAAVVYTSDGARVLVAHATGARASLVDTAGEGAPRAIDLTVKERREIAFLPMAIGPGTRTRSPRFEIRSSRPSQAFALVRTDDGVLAPNVLMDTGNGARTEGYGDSTAAFTHVGRFDRSGERVVETRHGERASPSTCLLPRAAAFDPTTARLFVACEGADRVVAFDTRREEGLWVQAPIEDRVRARVKVGAGAVGLAIEPARRRGVAFSQFDRTLAIFDLDARGPVAPERTVVLDPRGAPSPSLARGRALFHAVGGIRIAFDGRACASCHPDGRDDGLTWTTEDGPRQTPMLAERLEGTAPYGWDGANASIEDHLKRTMRRLGGTGIDASEKADLIAFVRSLRVPVKERPRDALTARGDALFHAEATGCSTCHLGDEALTDGQRHDVKSRQAFESVKAFDTPSLRFLAASAPYFHHGRFATLDELLAATDGTMGHTKQLDDDDRHALEAYLLSL